MYGELIYALNSRGLDILQNGKETGHGEMVHSMSRSLLLDQSVDLKLLDSFMRLKVPHSEIKGFLELSYMYSAPDQGKKFLSCFTPMVRDLSGAIDKRANLVTQIFVGDFLDIYPCELIGGDCWDAAGRGLPYYYLTSPASLAERSLKSDGIISFDAVGKFIADGRREALRSAVAFIMEQFNLVPEERKYLLIKDHTRNVEFWVAAIHYAFSPKIASRIGFATLMSDFVDKNTYYLDSVGRYCYGISEHKRCFCMIIGVDPRDEYSMRSTQTGGSAFVLLDGERKAMDFPAGNSNYYELISSFTAEHREFCQVLLQSTNIDKPENVVIQLWNDSKRLYGKNIDADTLVKVDDAYKMMGVSVTSGASKYITKRIFDELPHLFENDGMNAVKLSAHIYQRLGPKNRESIERRVCDYFLPRMYGENREGPTAADLWSAIERAFFKETVAQHCTRSSDAAQRYDRAIEEMPQWETKEAFSFLNLLSKCEVATGVSDEDRTQRNFNIILDFCHKAKDRKSAERIISNYGLEQIRLIQFLTDSTISSRETNYIAFVIDVLLTLCPQIRQLNQNALSAYRQWSEAGGSKGFFLLITRLDALDDWTSRLDFLEYIHNEDISADVLDIIYKKTDKYVDHNTDIRYAQALLKTNSNCVNSAHVVALKAMSKSRKDAGKAFDLALSDAESVDSWSEQYIEQLIKIRPDEKTIDAVLRYMRVPESRQALENLVHEADTRLQSKRESSIMGKLGKLFDRSPKRDDEDDNA